MTPDVNVLVAAATVDHSLHEPAYAWLEQATAASALGARLSILPMVAAGFLRIVTHPKIFARPATTDAALAFIQAVLSAPGVDMPELAGEWTVLCQLCRAGRLSGNRIPDAWIAAAVIARGDHLVSFDKGFRRLLPRRALTLLAAEGD
jgi:toxin-antitoxin system PIN domain toxin